MNRIVRKYSISVFKEFYFKEQTFAGNDYREKGDTSLKSVPKSLMKIESFAIFARALWNR